MRARRSKRSSARWSVTTRVTIAVTVAQSHLKKPATLVRSARWHHHATRFSKARVCLAPWRAHTTSSVTTFLQTTQDNRRISPWRITLVPNASRCRQRLVERS